MKILVDKEGEQILHQLLDIVLKTTGLQNVKAISQLLDVIKLEQETDPYSQNYMGSGASGVSSVSGVSGT